MTRAHRLLLPAALLAAALAGCSSDTEPATAAPTTSATPSRAPLPLLVRGTFTLELPNFVWSESTHTCAGSESHDDIQVGTQVIVTDPAGVNIAVGNLGEGQPVTDPNDSTRATSCLFLFDIANVPSGKGIYGIEVSNRGKVQFKETDLRDRVALGLT
ncbi:hypothetical protein [Micromonospora tarensis]|uniref:Uncharacterized protein n=1 Tax=Micromonospora tarensis TaxID=2806100 RepID=A0ABS1Y9S5_9ACTN|nr:hypothetical protein [Micromonospora tarensis]MBM0274148.1 hypothetical protein [Micromonospora tarensis]